MTTDIWNDEYLGAANLSLETPYWKLYLARLFGKEENRADDEGYRITCHWFRGKLYMTDYKRPTVRPK